MWIAVVVVLAVLLIGVGSIYWLLKSMGESGIEAAAPGSCRSGKCGVAASNCSSGSCAPSPLAELPADVLTGDVVRKDALSSRQTL